ncbi:MAG TPA: LytTR family DNA-binding domain-containing protein [Bacteroidia bacterium]|jgi:two-component system LytT family response regulator|nr:LytTR family DNA-binding domain-containing protein [Bacteroidia bacterium]
MIRAILVDDETKGRELLGLLIRENCPNVEIVGSASNIAQAATLLETLHPDLVFLDIEMAGGSGFDFLEQQDTTSFAVIFVTANNQYAIRAFKFSAIDYLLKPVDEEELVAAVGKAESHLKNKNPQAEVDNLRLHFNALKKSSTKLALSTQSGLLFIEITEIMRCEADGKYTTCFLADGKKHLVTKNLKEFEDFLSDYNFIRVHHSHLVNMDCIREYISGRGGYIIMNDGKNISISQRKKDEFLKRLNRI